MLKLKTKKHTMQIFWTDADGLSSLNFYLSWIGIALIVLGAVITSSSILVVRQIEKLNKIESKDRTISDVKSNLFMLFVKDYPKTPVKVFVGIEDYETDKFARKIRHLLDSSGYGSGEDIIRTGGGLVTSRIDDPREFSTNAITFVIHGDPNNGLFIPLGSGFTNDPALYAIQKLHHVKEAFSKIGLTGIYIQDSTLLKPAEVGIIVPLKNH